MLLITRKQKNNAYIVQTKKKSTNSAIILKGQIDTFQYATIQYKIPMMLNSKYFTQTEAEIKQYVLVNERVLTTNDCAF